MSLKKTFLFLLVLTWISEPLLGISPLNKSVAASKCLMKNPCHGACCCKKSESTPVACASLPGLYEDGCGSHTPQAAFSSQHPAKWFSSITKEMIPSFSKQNFVCASVFVPVPQDEILSPPPKAGFLS
jgi:hypothetical protein